MPLHEKPTIKFPAFSVNLKPVAKPRITKSSRKASAVKHLVYALCIKDGDVYKAACNTKGVEGFEETTIVEFTESSFNCNGKRDLFSTYPNSKGKHYTHYIREEHYAMLSPEVIPFKTPIHFNEIYSGYLIKKEGVLKFQMKKYIGSKVEYPHLVGLPAYKPPRKLIIEKKEED